MSSLGGGVAELSRALLRKPLGPGGREFETWPRRGESFECDRNWRGKCTSDTNTRDGATGTLRKMDRSQVDDSAVGWERVGRKDGARTRESGQEFRPMTPLGCGEGSAGQRCKRRRAEKWGKNSKKKQLERARNSKTKKKKQRERILWGREKITKQTIYMYV